MSDSGQSRREKFRQQKQKEMEVDVLQNIMKFVEDFLRNPSIWAFDNKEQNLLIYEVSMYVPRLSQWKHLYGRAFGAFYVGYG